MITNIEPQGILVSDCSLAGERKADGVFPAHPCVIQVSRKRWLWTYATRSVGCHDHDHSIVYQLRTDSPVGPVLKEGFLRQTTNHWDPFGDGSKYVALLRHPMGFGVPKGALVNGQPAPNANVFVVEWTRSAGGVVDEARGIFAYDGPLESSTLSSEWCQFKLNDAEDDIEILLPAQPLRQVGLEAPGPFCSHPAAKTMIHSLVPPVPFNASQTEWVETNQLDIGICAIKFKYAPQLGLYQWVETGPPLLPLEGFDLNEGTLAKVGTDWIMGVRMRIHRPQITPDWAGSRARDRGHTGWVKTADPFVSLPEPVIMESPHREAPMTVFTGADGKLRLFSGELKRSPYGQRRDPLYVWLVDPNDFSVSDERVVFDAVKAGVFADDGVLRSTCFGHLIPHAGGDSQYLVHRVLIFRYLPGVEPEQPALTQDQLAKFGLYGSKITYDRSYPPRWQFGP